METINNSKVVVLDSGLWEMKIGFAGDEAPRYTNRSVVGYSKNTAITASGQNRELFIGKNALEHKDLLHIEGPLVKESDFKANHIEKI